MRARPRRARPITLAILLTLVGALVSALLTGPASAGQSDVGSASAQVAAMQAKVAKVAAQLEAGTRAYENGQAHLKKVHREQRSVQRQAADLAAASAGAQARLNHIAAAAYRHPVPDTFVLALSSERGDVTSALASQADLEHVSGSQQDVLRTVVAARVRADALAVSAAQLAADASTTAKRLARQLERLRATADRANTELQAAARRLEQAQAAERARVAREQAARDRSARERASRARIATLVRVTAGSCLGESTDGYANGFIPDSALCPLWQAPGEQLRADAAAAFNRMSQAHAATVGGPLCLTDSYRSYSGQVQVYRRKPSLAATPGTSEHGWGKAVDFCGGIERYDSNAFMWMKANAGQYGFFHPDWAEPSGNRPEAWHWEYSG